MFIHDNCGDLNAYGWTFLSASLLTEPVYSTRQSMGKASPLYGQSLPLSEIRGLHIILIPLSCERTCSSFGYLRIMHASLPIVPLTDCYLNLTNLSIIHDAVQHDIKLVSAGKCHENKIESHKWTTSSLFLAECSANYKYGRLQCTYRANWVSISRLADGRSILGDRQLSIL